MVVAPRLLATSVVAALPLQLLPHQVVLDPVPPKHPIVVSLLPFPSLVLLNINTQTKHRHLRKSLLAPRRVHNNNIPKCLLPRSTVLPQREATLPTVSITVSMPEVPPMQVCMADI